MKIGIYGGTFNPVHNGHIHLAGCYKEALGLDRVIFIPAAMPPHKLAPDLAGDEDRFAMLKMAIAGLQGFTLSNMELERRGKSYTYDTIAAWRQTHPEDTLYLIVGSDMFLSFHAWYRWEELLQMVVLCTAARSPSDSVVEMEAYAREVLHLEAGRYQIRRFPVVLASSTDIRTRLRGGQSITDLVPPQVEQYLYEKGVYFADAVEHYKALLFYRLSEKRRYHCLCVADSARMLAERYGADADKAYQAGLLHDVMREEKPERQLQLLAEAGIILTSLEKNAVSLYHAMSGAVYCERTLGIRDRELLDAVRYHTTGRRHMTRMDKIIFVADIISADRNYPDVSITRHKAERSLDEALLYGLNFTVHNLTAMGAPVHPDTLAAYETIKSEAEYERT